MGAELSRMTPAVLADLARIRALFQARPIAAVIGAPPPDPARLARSEETRP